MSKKDMIAKLVEQNSAQILEINDTIWGFAEQPMHETKSAEYYVALFKKLGFDVRENIAGMPTAFLASWGSGSPVIGFLGEYDALPGLSQQAGCPTQSELVPGAYGHGCGHNSLGAGAAGAALALRDYLVATKKPGTVRFYGCPGEEAGSGKAFIARDGLFSDLDACFTWHSGNHNNVCGSSSLACLSVNFSFRGKTAHASGSPHLGRSALDAAELMSVGCNYLREHMPSDARLHYAYLNVGGIAPNVVQENAVVNYFIRSPKVRDMMELYERVCNVARGAALMTDTQVKFEIVEALSEYIPNRTLDAVMQQSFEEVGPPPFTDADRKLAAQFREGLNDKELRSTYDFLDELNMDRALIPESAVLCEVVLPYRAQDLKNHGSTDVGDASYCAPTSQIYVATQALATPGHSWRLTGQAKSPIAHAAVLTAAKVLALTAAKVVDDPDTLAKAKAEWLNTTGGTYKCPMPPELMPIL